MLRETNLPLFLTGVNNHDRHGRWAFAELTEVYEIGSDFVVRVEAEPNRMIEEGLKSKGPTDYARSGQQAEAMAIVREIRGKLRTGGSKFARDQTK